ncbi:hypothetical protein HHK36_024973 [Tetracentron sinense]|uniref:Uncharacterized protein n=1 Tax=Tetracentron sinense TaxID=13715 RepID=A0A834YL81_TETSI|nr:hypothetical protein HHK36_024973 [Tetracentron sinense]
MMEEMYDLHPTMDYSQQISMSPENLVYQADYQSLLSSGVFRDRIPIFGSDQLFSAASDIAEAASITPEIQRGGREEEMSSAIKAKIASHPCYPRLLEAYIDCQKVKTLFRRSFRDGNSSSVFSIVYVVFFPYSLLLGIGDALAVSHVVTPFSFEKLRFLRQILLLARVGAPPEIACLLDEIRRENGDLIRTTETYCNILVKYKSDLARPFDEATTFLNKIEMQLSDLCNGSSRSCASGLTLSLSRYPFYFLFTFIDFCVK